MTMMQEFFLENGIEFAYRNVTVYMPPETTGLGNGEIDKKEVEAAGAAAVAAEQAEEEKKKPK